MLHVFYVQTLAFIWTGWALLGNIAGHLTMEGHACRGCALHSEIAVWLLLVIICESFA